MEIEKQTFGKQMFARASSTMGHREELDQKKETCWVPPCVFVY